MKKILGLLVPVENSQRMSQFFCEVLDFEKVDEAHLESDVVERFYGLPDNEAIFTILRLGKEYVYLLESLKTKGLPYPTNMRSHDRIFQHMAIVVANMEEAHERLLKHGIRSISAAPQTIPEWNVDAAGIQAFYFHSPEGHPLELICFPMDKGHVRWHKKRCLFLGIDHTAITISNTENSLSFYEIILGLKKAGSTINYGITQEKLSGISDVKVKITGLRHHPEKEMGLEFLHYLFPLDGRAIPEGLNANDLVSISTVMEIESLASLKQNLARNKIPILSVGNFSPRVLTISQNALLLKDPDGHRILVVEKHQGEA